MKKTLGIYIHVPFCLKKCDYCDFCSFSGIGEREKDAYVDALCRDIRKWSEKCGGHLVDTVYFGGGTPTLLTVRQFEKLFSVLRDRYEISSSAEITVECNPATADTAYFKCLYEMGVNRLSIGVQSANDKELKALGRIHMWSDSVKAFSDARAAGFENISSDLMFGIPYQTEKSFENTLNKLIELSPDHISAYGLIIEPETPFFKKKKDLVLPNEDSEYNMYTGAIQKLAEQGFSRYEISNLALPYRESKHNLKYWRREEYLGFGASAHSFFDETRFYMPSNLDEYIKGSFDTVYERISKNDAANEYVMLSMRLAEGVSESEFASRFGFSFEEAFGKRFKRFEDVGLVVRKGGRCAFSERGFYVSNTVLSEVLDFGDHQ